MSNEAKPRLLLLRFTSPSSPSFLKLHFNEQERCLSQYFDVIVNNDRSCDYEQLCETHEPDIAMFESGNCAGLKEVRNVTSHSAIPKVGFLHTDAYYPARKNAICDMARWEISTFFSNSVPLGSYTPSIANDLLVWPNFVDPGLYRDYGFPKVIPILFTGSQAPHYPWRNKIDRIVSQHYPSLHSPHFGWSWKHGKPSASGFLEGEKYAQLINSSWIAPACGGIANEVVRKHFEIPACNACLLTQRSAALEAAGFADLVNCVFADGSDVLDKLEWLFENPDELGRITRAGKQLVDLRHTMQQRDEVFQWYTLHKNLKQGQKIVQLGPFQPLTIAAENSGANNIHVISGGVDRLLLDQGDEKLRCGKFNDAEYLYKKCSNFVTAPVPEAELKLIVCLLRKGNSKAALAIARKLTQDSRRGKNDLDPDPEEWAWLIITLLCCGKKREAALRADQFTNVRNEELDRVRRLVHVLSGDKPEAFVDMSRGRQRASIHQLPELAIEAWMENIGRILEACRQADSARVLASAGTKLQIPVVNEASNNPSPRRHTAENGTRKRDASVKNWLKARSKSVRSYVLKSYLAFDSRFDRFAQKTKPRFEKLMLRMSRSMSDRSKLIAESERSAVILLLQKEEIKSAILVGADDKSWLTQAVIRGVESNPNLPAVVCVNDNRAEFRKLHRRYFDNSNMEFRYVTNGYCRVLEQNESTDAVLVNCSVLTDTPFTNFRASVVLLHFLADKAGSEFFRGMLADDNYFLVMHEPHGAGYAVFRRVAVKTGFPHQITPCAA